MQWTIDISYTTGACGVTLFCAELPDTPIQRRVSSTANLPEREICAGDEQPVFEAPVPAHTEYRRRVILECKTLPDRDEDAGDCALWLTLGGLVDANDEMRRLVQSIIEEHASPMQIARACMDYVVAAIEYTWPPPQRGATHSLGLGKGDCGEMSVIFCALCRLAGLPARPVYGAFISDKMEPHVWAEVYIENRWVVADPSVARVHPIGLALYRMFGRRSRFYRRYAQKFLDFVPRDRIAFSRGCDIPVGDSASAPASSGHRTNFYGRLFFWGAELFAGRIPYLQPIYPLGTGGEPVPPFASWSMWRGAPAVCRALGAFYRMAPIGIAALAVFSMIFGARVPTTIVIGALGLSWLAAGIARIALGYRNAGEIQTTITAAAMAIAALIVFVVTHVRG